MTSRVDSSGVRLTDRIGIGIVTSAFPPELVDLAIEEWNAKEERCRTLSARVMAYYTMACAMNFDADYQEVWARLISGLTWARRHRHHKHAQMMPTTAALQKGRVRLNWQPVAEMLRKAAVRADLTPQHAPWAFFHGLRVIAIDGFTVTVNRNPDTIACFGCPSTTQGPAPFPQARIVALAEMGTRGLLGAQVAGLDQGELSLARHLWPSLHDGDLIVGDRRFLSHHDIQTILTTGAHAVIRAEASWDLPVVAVNPDGSYSSHIADPVDSPQRQCAKTPRPMASGIPIRVIEYSVTTDNSDIDNGMATDSSGHDSEMIRLITTLTDHNQYPIEGFPDLYHNRWRIETAIGDIETRLCSGSDVVLRSRRPDLILQEIYALLCVYQAIRHLITTGADHTGIDPDRVSFAKAKRATARATTRIPPVC